MFHYNSFTLLTRTLMIGNYVLSSSVKVAVPTLASNNNQLVMNLIVTKRQRVHC